MFGKKLTLIVFLIRYCFNSNDEIMTPAILIHTSIFVHKEDGKEFLHIFMLKGDISLTDRSLQYYFFNDLQLSHTKVQNMYVDTNIGSIDQFPSILKDLVSDKKRLKILNSRANIKIKPILFSIKDSKSKDLTKNNEESYIGKILKNYDEEFGSFVLYGNDFRREGDSMVSLADVSKDKGIMALFLERFQNDKVFDGIKRLTFEPIKLSFLNSKYKIKPQKNGVYYAFDLVNINGVWKTMTFTELPSGQMFVKFKNLSDFDSGHNLIEDFNKIFQKNSSASEKSKIVTKFVQNSFFAAFENLVKNKAYFDNFINPNYKKKKNEHEFVHKNGRKFTIIGEVKPSFEENVMETGAEVFIEIKEEVAGENPIKEEPIEEETTKKETEKKRISGGKTAAIVIVIIGVMAAFGVAGWYYFTYVKGKKVARNRR